MVDKPDKSAKYRGFKLVSFEIDPEDWKRFRKLSIDLDTTSSALIRKLIQNELKRTKSK